MILLTHQRPSQCDAALPRERKEGERKPKAGSVGSGVTEGSEGVRAALRDARRRNTSRPPFNRLRRRSDAAPKFHLPSHKTVCRYQQKFSSVVSMKEIPELDLQLDYTHRAWALHRQPDLGGAWHAASWPRRVNISQTLKFRAPVKIGDTVVVTVTVAESCTLGWWQPA